MSRAQADKLEQLKQQGWIILGLVEPNLIGGPVVVRSPDGKMWIVSTDGILKEK